MLTFPASNSQLLIWWLCTFASILLVAYLFSWVVAKGSALFLKVKLLRKHTIVAEYTPPGNLLPYELGYLYDNKFADNELLAALICLAQKNAVALEGATIADYVVRALPVDYKHKQRFSDAELAVYASVASAKGGSASWRKLSSSTSEVVGAQNDFEGTVVAQLQRKGYLQRGSMLSTLAERRVAIKYISLFLTLVFFYLPLYLVHSATQVTSMGQGFADIDQGVSMLSVILFSLLIWPLMYGYCQLVAYVYFRAAGLPVGSTAQLRALWPQVVGYRVYVKTVEWPQLQSTIELRNEVLPYCVAYGLHPRSVS